MRSHLQGSSLSSGLEAFQHPVTMDPFCGLTSRYLPLKYYRDVLDYCV